MNFLTKKIIQGEKTIFSKQQYGGDNFVAQSSFLFSKTNAIAFSNNKTNSKGYKDIISENLFPEASLFT